MKRATSDDLKSNSNKYAAFWCRHNSKEDQEKFLWCYYAPQQRNTQEILKYSKQRRMEEIARYIEERPDIWLFIINSLIARIQKQKRSTNA